MMKTTDGFHYAFNAQAVVDEEAQVVLAHSVSNQAADVAHLIEMIEATEANLGAADIDENPDTLIADAGYFSEKNVNDATDAGVDVLIATGRIRHGRTGAGRTERSRSQETPRSRRRWRADSAPKRTDRLRQTQGHRRTGLRTDEGPTTRRVPPSTRTRRCPGRVDPACRSATTSAKLAQFGA